MNKDKERPCERKCKRCEYWKHYSRFASRQRTSPKGTVWEFDSICLDCQQRERNERKNIDRPKSIIRQRAAAAAAKAGKTAEFFWTQMNYKMLVPQMRAMMSKEGGCISCGHPFVDQGDIPIEHIEPPRHVHDWARLHARNLRLMCTSCNGRKAKKSFAQWLDEQEEARLSNLQEAKDNLSELVRQPTLFSEDELKGFEFAK